ncbi:hypothetical protein CAP48_03655 [Advenella sp. S44]|uniref:hypothetical protein n=1 Tax=Advenella sp. S44 TaxID=1982755 RepID=UPI000C2A683F|nr:hypothetical protein [Advenella sp. S44]PJX28273.1 hypothetical protein CAP48_03655 [Advenella sp. S44]
MTSMLPGRRVSCFRRLRFASPTFPLAQTLSKNKKLQIDLQIDHTEEAAQARRQAGSKTRKRNLQAKPASEIRIKITVDAWRETPLGGKNGLCPLTDKRFATRGHRKRVFFMGAGHAKGI